jgi:hypothetical protein
METRASVSWATTQTSKLNCTEPIIFFNSGYINERRRARSL